ncbi:hypothetical protein KY284_035325 [Solanum tuberosum]|nr:hypothetical protein KY284_035325 [Solanum tuberosum]
MTAVFLVYGCIVLMSDGSLKRSHHCVHKGLGPMTLDFAIALAKTKVCSRSRRLCGFESCSIREDSSLGLTI